MKILITGGQGQIAFDLIRLASGHQVYAPSRAELDITHKEMVTKKIQDWQPDVIINTAAYTAVDLAENETVQAFKINNEGAKNIAQAAEKIKCPLLHLSTDYIFDGAQQNPYHEKDTASPLNVYGQSKFFGEMAIQENAEKYLILRVSGVFGAHGKNFVKTILKLAAEREELRIVNDQITGPTPASAIAETLLQLSTLIQKNPAWGIYHYCGAPQTTWFDFAEKIIALGKEHQPLKVQSLEAITTQQFAALAKRPPNSVLDCSKIKNTFGIEQPDWVEGIKKILGVMS